MKRFLTTMFLAGMLTTPAWAGPQGRPSGSDNTETVASKVEKPTVAPKSTAPAHKKGKKGNNDDALAVAGDIYSILQAFGFDSPAIASLLDGLDARDLNALLLDLADGNLAGLDLGKLGDIFQAGDTQPAKHGGNGKGKGKSKSASKSSAAKSGKSSLKAEMLAMKGQ